MMSTTNTPVQSHRQPTNNRPRAARPASERIGKQARKVADDLQKLGGIAGNAAQEKLGQLRDNATDYYDQGHEKVHQVTHTFEQFIRDQPFKSILIAAGIGLVLGRFWMRR